ncbi:helix-turn-helix domain-containing protein, partial [Prosthecobacter sp.]|uniref:helix-turn-helix domain-containing protein n=1 Tax=Prosthecobacter sp. TaxID=1965333 RepID=UPI0037831043
MSRTGFERKFRCHFGCSPHGEILKVRLQQAHALLTRTRLSIAEVAERAGFSSG